MLSWTIQITIISIILIFLIHHLINFFTSALTVPKIKDLVNVPHKKYENIFNVINNIHADNDYDTNTNTNNQNNNNKYELDIEKLLPKNDTSMKNELKNFIKKQFNSTASNLITNNSQNSTSISKLDSYIDNNGGGNNYSFI
jgi:hypothetical protein